MYRIEQRSDIADSQWLGYDALIFEGKKKRRGYANGNHFILPNGFEGFSGEQGLTIFPAVQAKTLIVAPNWLDLVNHVLANGKQEHNTYISTNGYERLLTGYVEETAPELVILAMTEMDEGLAHDLGDILDAYDVVYGTQNIKKRPLVQKAFIEHLVKPQGVPRYQI